ncbi:MAG: hypothetical protein K0S45_4345 [Nitrospira sp.]|jgi:hypothetical protein|nr:hypothetical protein [Nitrospira sp.]
MNFAAFCCERFAGPKLKLATTSRVLENQMSVSSYFDHIDQVKWGCASEPLGRPVRMIRSGRRVLGIGFPALLPSSWSAFILFLQAMRHGQSQMTAKLTHRRYLKGEPSIFPSHPWE